MSIEFKVGQIWETRNEKARGVISEISSYKTAYPIKLFWDAPYPDFVQERPVTLDDEEAHRWDLFRADGRFSMEGSTVHIQWDLVRLVETPEPDIRRYDLETDRIIEEQASNPQYDVDKRLEDRATTCMIAYDFAKIAAQARPDLPAKDIARCAFDLAEAMISEQGRRGYR
jgi:hypothetical protein